MVSCTNLSTESEFYPAMAFLAGHSSQGVRRQALGSINPVVFQVSELKRYILVELSSICKKAFCLFQFLHI